MPLFEFIFFFFFGLIAGSFINVLAFRSGAFSLFGRSRCLSCNKTLQWFELIPLLSFFLQRRRCRLCHSRISWQYPLVEFITGVVFTLIFWKHLSFFSPLFNYSIIRLSIIGGELFIWSLLIAIAVYDLKHKIIPNTFVYGFVLLSFLHLIFSYFILNTLYFPPRASFLFDFWGGPILAIPLAAIWFLSRGKAIGLGDAKLALGMGWFLGLVGGVSAFVIGFWLGALFAIAALALRFVAARSRSFIGLKSSLKGITMKSELPLAPFLILGTFLVYLFEIDVIGLSFLISNI